MTHAVSLGTLPTRQDLQLMMGGLQFTFSHVIDVGSRPYVKGLAMLMFCAVVPRLSESPSMGRSVFWSIFILVFVRFLTECLALALPPDLGTHQGLAFFVVQVPFRPRSMVWLLICGYAFPGRGRYVVARLSNLATTIYYVPHTYPPPPASNLLDLHYPS